MEEDEERRAEVMTALRKFGIAIVGIAVLIFVFSKVFVNFFDLSTDDTTTYSNGNAAPEPTALPTVAITPTKSPTSRSTAEPTDEPTDIPTNIVTPSPGNGDLFLNASPVYVKAMERINLTGQWPGHDNVGLLVQRLERGEWVDFGVQVNVQVGTFETYVMTGREGDNKFRVFDPETNTTSNTVDVTISS